MSLDFSVTYSFRPYHGPGIDSAPSENEYQEHFLRVKAAGAWGWQPHHLHVLNVMEIWAPKPPGTVWATPGLLRDCFTFYLCTTWDWVVTFTPQPVYCQGRNPWNPPNRFLGGPLIFRRRKTSLINARNAHCAPYLFWLCQPCFFSKLTQPEIQGPPRNHLGFLIPRLWLR